VRFQETTALFLRPGTLDEALAALAETRATVLSGGTDLFPALSFGPLRGAVLDISAISELKGIRFTDSYIEIGGRATWSEIVSANLPRGFDGLKAAAREIGAVQIQNQATVAGNICNASPAADGLAALMALDAEVTLASHLRLRTLPLGDFVLGNRKTRLQADELLTSIRIPRRLENAASSFLKLGARRYLVISIVMVAANLVADSERRIREALICVGSCSPKALRLVELERALAGCRLNAKISELVRTEHFSTLTPIDDVRATAAYRRDAAETLVKRALEACAKKAR
jgi:CO/xanthine dehydrogenase FAD-binding subunit